MLEQNFGDSFRMLAGSRIPELLHKGKWGLEKETHRIDRYGNISLEPHPAAFGNKLENPFITVDFAESQLELITPPSTSIEGAYHQLLEIQGFVLNHTGDELLWPFSMPPILPEDEKIPVAKFGNSEEGKKNENYRNGLSVRYGKKMQTISGIHYNFSFPVELIEELYHRLPVYSSIRDFTDRIYFAVARNYLRYRWLLIYLFGASPIADRSFFDSDESYIKASRNFETAVSLRMSPLGYSGEKRQNLNVSYDSLERYTADLENALRSCSRDYDKKNIPQESQINCHILQKESEFYSPVRMKSFPDKGKSHLAGLKKRGVQYLEIRSVDLNPYYQAGVSLEQLYFYHLFLLYCLFEKSPSISGLELGMIQANDEMTALEGRDKGIKIHHPDGNKIPLHDFARQIIGKMAEITYLMDGADGCDKYRKALSEQSAKLNRPELLPASMIMKEIKENHETIIGFGLKKAVSGNGPAARIA